MKQLPNIISIFRTALAILLAIFVLNNFENQKVLNYAFWITWIVIILDGIDGIIARVLKVTSDFGAFFDIACDRIIELIYISLFVTLKWIPFWILIIFLVRGVLVDGIRGFASKEGKTAFGEKSMMKSKLGYFLTSSRFMRFSYGGIKAFAFAFMFLAHGLMPQLLNLEIFLVYFMTFYCVLRGVPVLIEGRKFFS
ncbi:MAG: CDP-alcohol phosphatidyltransferase family protein [Candidatus Melainabacteria bacterium]|nr:CDP-alcohol phosphatidyltransferase family protein [Candidatus Melainabacteria bacterium]